MSKSKNLKDSVSSKEILETSSLDSEINLTSVEENEVIAQDDPAPNAYSDYWLVVKNPFEIYKKGDLIQDPAIVEEVLTGPYRFNVVKVAAQTPFIEV